MLLAKLRLRDWKQFLIGVGLQLSNEAQAWSLTTLQEGK